MTHDASFLGFVTYYETCQYEKNICEEGYTYALAILTRPLNTLLRIVAAVHVRTLVLAKAIVHQAVAQPDALLRLCEHHFDCCWCVPCGVVVYSPGAVEM